MNRVPVAERADWRVEADQLEPDVYVVRVSSPDGRSWARWYARPAGRCKPRRGRPAAARPYVLASSPSGAGYIRSYPTFEAAATAANLNARRWLGSSWGLKGPARRLP
jgi:hypothetical protein